MVRHVAPLSKAGGARLSGAFDFCRQIHLNSAFDGLDLSGCEKGIGRAGKGLQKERSDL
jgi:hypothetical protein